MNVNRRKESTDSGSSSTKRRSSKDSRRVSLDKHSEELDCDNSNYVKIQNEDENRRRSVDDSDNANLTNGYVDQKALDDLAGFVHNVIVTNASVEIQGVTPDATLKTNLDSVKEESNSVLDTLDCIDKHGLVSPARSACVSPASSNGGVYSVS